LQLLAERYPGFFEEVRGAGMLFALQLRPVVPQVGLAPELIAQLGTFLGIRSLQHGGIQTCYSFNSNRTVRLTPALNMPEPLFEEMFRRLGRTAQKPQSGQLLRTPPEVLAKLASLALRG
jgi:putrescine aminotransferase